MVKHIINALKQVIKGAILSDPTQAVAYYRNKGVIIGNNVKLYNVKMDARRPYLITIGNNVILTNCRLLTHDASMFLALGYTKIGRITIGDNVFVGVDCVILPNIRIGNNVVVGAGSVVSKDIPDDSVAVGNPLRIISSYSEFIAKHKDRLKTCPLYINHKMSAEEVELMKNDLEHTCGYSSVGK